jgi:hypothetical protein
MTGTRNLYRVDRFFNLRYRGARWNSRRTRPMRLRDLLRVARGIFGGGESLKRRRPACAGMRRVCEEKGARVDLSESAPSRLQ